MPRALLVKLGAIGDVIMAIPAARALQQQGYQVDWVCGEFVAPLLGLYPWINVLPVNEGRLLRQGKAAALQTVAAVWRQLAGQRYDLCATLYYDRRYRLLTLPVRAARKVFLSRDDRRYRFLDARHDPDEYLRVLLGRKDGETPWQVSPVPPETLPANPRARVPGKQRLVLVPGGAKNLLRDDALRRWPLHHYVQLAAQLLRDGHEVALVGGPDDVWASAAFAQMDVTDTIGKLPLVDTLALLDSADLTVTHDTGPLHLAGLSRSAIVALFGPTPPLRFFPQVPNAVALWGGEGFACRPCYDGRDYAPCEHNGCMEQITPALVLQEVERLLRSKAAGERLLPRIVTPERTPLVQIGEAVR